MNGLPREDKATLKQHYLFILFVITVANNVFYLTTLNNIYFNKIGWLICFLCIPLIVEKVYLIKYKRWQDVLFLLTIIFLIFTSMRVYFMGSLGSTMDVTFITSLVFIMSVDFSDKIEIDRLIMINVVVEVVCLLIVAVLIKAGVLTNTLLSGSRNRFTLGFSSPNGLPFVLLSITIGWYYLKRFKVNTVSFLFLLFTNYYVYRVTNSRTAFAVLLLFFVMVLIFRYIPRSVRNVLYIMMVVLISMIFFSIIATYQFGRNSAFMNFIDTITSGRISMQNYYLQMYGNTLFGQPIKFNITGFNYFGQFYVLDNSYFRMLIMFGTVPFFIICAYILFKILKMFKQHYYRELVCILSIMMYCIFERWIDNIFLVPMLLLLFFQNSSDNIDQN